MTEVEPASVPLSQAELEFADLDAEPVDDAFGGMVARRGFSDSAYAHPGVRLIMEQVGTVFRSAPPDRHGETQQLPYIPNIPRLRAATQHNDIPITLISEASPSGNIPAKDYAAAVRILTHPVGLGRLQAYQHDICEDHMPAIVVGGRELISVMVEAMGDIISNGREVSERYDLATMEIREAIFNLLSGRAMTEIDRALDWAATRLVRGVGGPFDRLQTDPHIMQVDRQLRAVITKGLKRLGVDHRDILREDDRSRQERLLGDWAVRP